MPLANSPNISISLYMSTLHDFLNHPIESLEKALHIRKQIAVLEKALQEVMGSSPAPVVAKDAAPKRRGRRTMSAEARAKIANAQRLRWAKSKGLESATLAGPAETAPVPKSKTKSGMSAAGRARIAAAQKLRWAKVKAGKSTPAKAAPAANKKKRTLSPEARARIVAAVKARWARVKGK
jgi:hypothetical protein